MEKVKMTKLVMNISFGIIKKDDELKNSSINMVAK